MAPKEFDRELVLRIIDLDLGFDVEDIVDAVKKASNVSRSYHMTESITLLRLQRRYSPCQVFHIVLSKRTEPDEIPDEKIDITPVKKKTRVITDLSDSELPDGPFSTVMQFVSYKEKLRFRGVSSSWYRRIRKVHLHSNHTLNLSLSRDFRKLIRFRCDRRGVIRCSCRDYCGVRINNKSAFYCERCGRYFLSRHTRRVEFSHERRCPRCTSNNNNNDDVILTNATRYVVNDNAISEMKRFNKLVVCGYKDPEFDRLNGGRNRYGTRDVRYYNLHGEMMKTILQQSKDSLVELECMNEASAFLLMRSGVVLKKVRKLVISNESVLVAFPERSLFEMMPNITSLVMRPTNHSSRSTDIHKEFVKKLVDVSITFPEQMNNEQQEPLHEDYCNYLANILDSLPCVRRLHVDSNHKAMVSKHCLEYAECLEDFELVSNVTSLVMQPRYDEMKADSDEKELVSKDYVNYANSYQHFDFELVRNTLDTKDEKEHYTQTTRDVSIVFPFPETKDDDGDDQYEDALYNDYNKYLWNVLDNLPSTNKLSLDTQETGRLSSNYLEYANCIQHFKYEMNWDKLLQSDIPRLHIGINAVGFLKAAYQHGNSSITELSLTFSHGIDPSVFYILQRALMVFPKLEKLEIRLNTLYNNHSRSARNNVFYIKKNLDTILGYLKSVIVKTDFAEYNPHLRYVSFRTDFSMYDDIYSDLSEEELSVYTHEIVEVLSLFNRSDNHPLSTFKLKLGWEMDWDPFVDFCSMRRNFRYQHFIDSEHFSHFYFFEN